MKTSEFDLAIGCSGSNSWKNRMFSFIETLFGHFAASVFVPCHLQLIKPSLPADELAMKEFTLPFKPEELLAQPADGRLWASDLPDVESWSEKAH